MRQLISILGGIALVAAVAGPASAEKLAFHGTSILKFSNFGGIESTVTGTGVATVNGSLGGAHLFTLKLTNNFGTLNTVIPVTDPIVNVLIPSVRLTSVRQAPQTLYGLAKTASGGPAQGGTFAAISGATATQTLTQNTMASTGQIKICLLSTTPCSNALTAPVFSRSTLSAPIEGAGVGGLFTIGGTMPVRVSVVGSPWTVKTVTVFNRTDEGGTTPVVRHGFAHGPNSNTSSTATVSGVIQLVTANQTTTVGVPGNNDLSGTINTLRLHFIPEPGLLLLLGSGAVGVALLGRKRANK